jgi:hypothetical protein
MFTYMWLQTSHKIVSISHTQSFQKKFPWTTNVKSHLKHKSLIPCLNISNFIFLSSSKMVVNFATMKMVTILDFVRASLILFSHSLTLYLQFNLAISNTLFWAYSLKIVACSHKYKQLHSSLPKKCLYIPWELVILVPLILALLFFKSKKFHSLPKN